jgi:ABC-2 type transport system ATP-binding protein
MSDVRLSVRDLRVDYEDTTAVYDVSFDIEAGMIYGLIGPNGAGKTSIIRSVAALVDPTYGEIHIEQKDLIEQTSAALRHVGYMPDAPPLYEDLTVREFLELFASAYGIPIDQRSGRIQALVDQVRLTEKIDSMAGALSRGMRQRLFLAKCLLHDPDVLLLDEPASGLDPIARRQLGEIIKDLGAQGKAVLVSSHILSELADFCNSVGIMEQGCMRISGRIQDILDGMDQARQISIRLLRPDTRLPGFLETRSGITGVTSEGLTVSMSFGGDDDTLCQLLKELVQADFPVMGFHEIERNLEDIFYQVTDGGVA